MKLVFIYGALFLYSIASLSEYGEGVHFVYLTMKVVKSTDVLITIRS